VRSGQEDCLEGALEEFLKEGRAGRSCMMETGDQGREARVATEDRGGGGIVH